MENERIPRPGQICQHFKDKPYQIITVAEHTETHEVMVVYQALYGDFKTYVRPLEMFLSEVDHEKYPHVQQKYRFELRTTQPQGSKQETEQNKRAEIKQEIPDAAVEINQSNQEGAVNTILMNFLDADTYSKKLDILTSNIKKMNDRLVNDMAVALDCAVDDGPLEQRINGLINCLQAMCRFENRRLR